MEKNRTGKLDSEDILKDLLITTKFLTILAALCVLVGGSYDAAYYRILAVDFFPYISKDYEVYDAVYCAFPIIIALGCFFIFELAFAHAEKNNRKFSLVNHTDQAVPVPTAAPTGTPAVAPAAAPAPTTPFDVKLAFSVIAIIVTGLGVIGIKYTWPTVILSVPVGMLVYIIGTSVKDIAAFADISDKWRILYCTSTAILTISIAQGIGDAYGIKSGGWPIAMVEYKVNHYSDSKPAFTQTYIIQAFQKSYLLWEIDKSAIRMAKEDEIKQIFICYDSAKDICKNASPAK